MRNRFSLIRIVAVALLLYSLWSLFDSYSGIKYAERVTSAMECSLETLRTENSELKKSIELAESGELLDELARRRLNYIQPGERVFVFSDEK